MSQIRVTPEEFADLAIVFLMENLKSDDPIVDNERWNSLVELMEDRGVKPAVMKSYLKMDADTRVKYKRIKNVFDGGESAKINIAGSKEGKPDSIATDINKKFIKKVFKKIKEVRYRTSMPMTEERVDKIIDYVAKQEEQE